MRMKGVKICVKYSEEYLTLRKHYVLAIIEIHFFFSFF